MDTLERIKLAEESHLEVKEIDGATFVLIPTLQVDTFLYYPNSRNYVYNYKSVVEKNSVGLDCYRVPIAYLELDREFIP